MTDAVMIATPRGPEPVDVVWWVDAFGQRFFVHFDAAEHVYVMSEYRTGRKISQGGSIGRAVSSGKQSLRTWAKARNTTPEQLIDAAIRKERKVNK